MFDAPQNGSHLMTPEYEPEVIKRCQGATFLQKGQLFQCRSFIGAYIALQEHRSGWLQLLLNLMGGRVAKKHPNQKNKEHDWVFLIFRTIDARRYSSSCNGCSGKKIAKHDHNDTIVGK